MNVFWSGRPKEIISSFLQKASWLSFGWSSQQTSQWAQIGTKGSTDFSVIQLPTEERFQGPNSDPAAMWQGWTYPCSALCISMVLLLFAKLKKVFGSSEGTGLRVATLSWKGQGLFLYFWPGFPLDTHAGVARAHGVLHPPPGTDGRGGCNQNFCDGSSGN